MKNFITSSIEDRVQPNNPIPNLFICIGWNWRSLNINKILFINFLIEKYKSDWMIICETWLKEVPKGWDKRYETFRTKDTNHQGIWIITKKNIVCKSYINEEPFIIAVELINKTFIIGIYMKEGVKQVILEQLKNLRSRIRRKYQNLNIIIFWWF